MQRGLSLRLHEKPKICVVNNNSVLLGKIKAKFGVKIERIAVFVNYYQCFDKKPLFLISAEHSAQTAEHPPGLIHHSARTFSAVHSAIERSGDRSRKAFFQKADHSFGGGARLFLGDSGSFSDAVDEFIKHLANLLLID
jgi:hypothetical protein